MNIENADLSNVSLDDLTPADKWILSKANSLVNEVTDNMENYDFGVAVSKLNDFIWEEFCDWYIEMVKPRLYNEEDTTKAAALFTLKKVLTISLKLLHPYMPFITEEIFCSLQDEAVTDQSSLKKLKNARPTGDFRKAVPPVCPGVCQEYSKTSENSASALNIGGRINSR